MDLNTFATLYADETLDGFLQDYSNDNTFDHIRLDSSNSCSALDETNSPCKRKRDESLKLATDLMQRCDKKLKQDEINLCSLIHQVIKQEHIKKEPIDFDSSNLHIEEVSVSESCSLFSTVSLSWVISGRYKNCNSFSRSYESDVCKQTNPKNGIWLKMDHSKQSKDTYILMELHETSNNTDLSKERLVEFCSRGKCGSKKKEVIELHNPCVSSNKGHFEAIIAINEQCAHRSENEYGAPRTLFYFVMKVYEKENGRLSLVMTSRSSFVKVVAPGKNKTPSNSKKVSSSVGTVSKIPSSIKSMESILQMLQVMSDRIAQLEEVKVKHEERISQLEEQIRNTPMIVQQIIQSAFTSDLPTQELLDSTDTSLINSLLESNDLCNF